MSIPDPLQTSLPLILKDTPNATSSPASADGPYPFPWLVGQRIGPSGLVLAPASPSVKQEKERAKLIRAISGPHGSISSESADLLRSLASRLLQRLPSAGSMEYRLTWKARVTPQGRLICALRASPRRTSDSASISLPETPLSALAHGWATPTVSDSSSTRNGTANRSDPNSRHHDGMTLVDQASLTARLGTCNTPRATDGENGGPNQSGGALPHDAAMMAPLASYPTPTVGNAMGSQMAKGASATERRPNGSKATVSLPQVASLLASWPSPMAGSPATETYNEAGNTDSSRKTVALVSPWATPSSRDWKDTPGMATTGTNPDGSTRLRLDQLPRQAALTSGPTSNSSTAETGKSAVLNPDLSRWLHGYPAAWLSCGASAMQSMSKSRRNLSART